MNKLSIVFFGSGPVAYKSLEFLHTQFSIEAVVTKNRPAHHKDPAPVEEFARAHKLKLIFADNATELEQQKDTWYTSPCGVVIDYGVIISQSVIDSFTKGIVNSHFSLLPEWRGADPITFSLLSGQPKTGVCLMLIDNSLDTGPIIARKELPIASTETNPTLTDKLISISNDLLTTNLQAYCTGNIKPVAQDTNLPITYSRKLRKQDALLDTSKPASVLERQVRAFCDWPKSKITIGDNTLIITKSVATKHKLAIGKIKITDDGHMLLGTKVGSLDITELTPSGKKPMDVKSFLNGYRNSL